MQVAVVAVAAAAAARQSTAAAHDTLIWSAHLEQYWEEGTRSVWLLGQKPWLVRPGTAVTGASWICRLLWDDDAGPCPLSVHNHQPAC